MAQHLWFIYALGAAVLWGFSYALTDKILKAGIAPIQFFALEFIIALPILILLAAFYSSGIKSGAELLLSNKTLLLYFLLCVFSFVLGTFFIFTSISEKNATLSSIIEISYPLFTILFSWLLFREFHLNFYSVIGAVLILSGTVLILVKS